VSVLRRSGDWLSYAALGPLLVLGGAAALYIGLDLFVLDYGLTAKSLALGIALAGAVPLILGLVLTLRPASPYWIAIVAIAFPVAANLAYDIVVPTNNVGRAEDVARWVVIGLGIALYAHHCHRPAYSRRGGRRLPGEMAADDPSA